MDDYGFNLAGVVAFMMWDREGAVTVKVITPTGKVFTPDVSEFIEFCEEREFVRATDED